MYLQLDSNVSVLIQIDDIVPGLFICHNKVLLPVTVRLSSR